MHSSSLLSRAALACLALVAPLAIHAQQLALNTEAPAPPSATAPAPMSTLVRPAPAAPALPAWENKFDRWIDLHEMDSSMRYRSVFDSNNAHEYNQGQQRSIVDGKFKFDEQGRYGIAFHASTGKYFNWAYADFMGGGNQKGFNLEFDKATPIQQAAVQAFMTPSRIADQEASGGWSFYVRRLYLDIEPIHGIELQYGGLDIDRGAASEITTYDYDGYIAGERLLLKDPKKLFFDEASVTYAYLGDLYTPNFFARGERLKQSNYHQFLLRKHVGKWLDTSFDYTWQDASNTFRQAAEFKVRQIRFLDSVRLETYERANAISFREIVDFAPGGKGLAVTANKRVNRRLFLEGGVALIDPHQAVLTQSEASATLCMAMNGDAYGLGKRYFVRPAIKLTPYLDLTGFYTHQFGAFSVHDQIVWNKEALNAGFVFDIKKVLFPKSRVQ